MFSAGEVLHPEEVAKRFGVSMATARRDLKLLGELPNIRKVYGGAVKLENEPDDASLHERQHLHTKEKDAIGAYCAGLVRDGDLIMLDNGTTALSVAKNLRDRNITVVTNSLLVLNELASYRPEVVALGGNLRKEELSITGHTVLRELKSYNISKYFMSVSGLSPETDVSDFHHDEIEVKKVAMSCSREVYIIADHSKFGFIAPRNICALSEVKQIITDTGLSEDEVGKYAEAGAVIRRVEVT